MSKKERQNRYFSTGAGSGLQRVETLVPEGGREQILALAEKLRGEHRIRAARTKLSPEAKAIVERAISRSKSTAKKIRPAENVDKLVETSVNVPFPDHIDALTLAAILKSGILPGRYAPHVWRFIEEEDKARIARFLFAHNISEGEFQTSIKKFPEGMAFQST